MFWRDGELSIEEFWNGIFRILGGYHGNQVIVPDQQSHQSYTTYYKQAKKNKPKNSKHRWN